MKIHKPAWIGRLHQKKRRKSRFRRRCRGMLALALFAGALFGWTMTEPSMFPNMQIAWADQPLEEDTGGDTDSGSESGDETSLQFYKAASAGASAYDSQVDKLKRGDQSNIKKPMNFDYNLGKAGSVMGYQDDDMHGVIGWVKTSFSMASQSIGYGRDSTGVDASTVQAYLLYGRLWDKLGVDETGSEAPDLFRFLKGGILTLIYRLSNAVTWMFQQMLSFIQFMNPFRFLYTSNSAGMDMLRSEMDDVGMETGLVDHFGAVGKTLSNIYDAAHDFSWQITVPFLLVSSILAVTLITAHDPRDAKKKLLLNAARILFLGLGIPLLGMVYTSAIDQMVDLVDGKNIGSDYVILSTLVDYENWVKDSNMAVPNDLGIKMEVSNTNTGDLNPIYATSLRNIAQEINRKAGLITAADDEFDQDLSTMMQDQSSTISMKVEDLLARYQSGGLYHAADYEADMKGLMEGKEDTESLEKLQEPDEWPEQVGSNPLTSNGNLTVSFTEIGGGGRKPVRLSFNQDEGGKGLSTLAMYNYLNSSFDQSSVTIYSPDKSVSGMVSKSHRSVSMIDSGWLENVYWLWAVVMMGSFIVIGLFYSIGLIGALMGNTIRMFQGILLTSFGSLKFMARLIALVIITLTEIITTFFVYTVVVDLLIGCSDLIMNLLNSENKGSFGLAGSAQDSILALINIIVIAVLTFYAIKVRKQIIGTVTESVNSFTERIMSNAAGVPKTKKDNGGGSNGGGSNSGGGNRSLTVLNSGGDSLPGGSSGGVTETSVNPDDPDDSSGGGGSATPSPVPVSVENVKSGKPSDLPSLSGTGVSGIYNQDHGGGENLQDAQTYSTDETSTLGGDETSVSLSNQEAAGNGIINTGTSGSADQLESLGSSGAFESMSTSSSKNASSESSSSGTTAAVNKMNTSGSKTAGAKAAAKEIAKKKVTDAAVKTAVGAATGGTGAAALQAVQTVNSVQKKSGASSGSKGGSAVQSIGKKSAGSGTSASGSAIRSVSTSKSAGTSSSSRRSANAGSPSSTNGGSAMSSVKTSASASNKTNASVQNVHAKQTQTNNSSVSSTMKPPVVSHSNHNGGNIPPAHGGLQNRKQNRTSQSQTRRLTTDRSVPSRSVMDRTGERTSSSSRDISESNRFNVRTNTNGNKTKE